MEQDDEEEVRRGDNDEDEEHQEEDEEEDDHDDDDASTIILDDSDDDNNKNKNKCQRGAMEPANILLPFYRLRKTLESHFGCPKCSKKKLKVTQETYGFATELTITCDACGHVEIVAPGVESTRMERGDDADEDEDGNHYNEDHKDSSSMFMDYGINYAMVLLMQHLGMGLRGVVMILAFLGIAAGAGNQTKWQRIQEELGLAEEEVANRTIENNIKLEIAATRLQAQEQYAAWLLTNEGTNASEQEKLMKMTELLAMRMSQEGLQKIGLTVGMDGAWQKRSIGRGSYNSKTGHNFCVGGLTKKILSVVVYSKHCRTCEKAEGLQVEALEHRCPRNYDAGRSSKAMEPLAAVAHCKNLAASADPHLQCYVAQLVTDDDSTTRANTKHSFKAVADRDYPGWTQKRNTAWPFKVNDDTNKRTYLPDHGLLPLWVPSINKYLCDISHRVKVIGSAVYNLSSTGSNPKRLKAGWNKYDAERIKFNAGYFFHQEENQSLPFQIFCEQVHCIYLHHFNNHSRCNQRWCRVLRNQNDPTYELPARYKTEEKFRETESVQGRGVLDKVKEALEPYLTPEALAQVYHGYSTQKNESLNRKMSAVAPKDRFYGGTNTLRDRANLVVVNDSIGSLQSFESLFQSLGIKKKWNPILSEWARRQDKSTAAATTWRSKPGVKKKRAVLKFELFNQGIQENKRAKKDGTYYKSGVAVTGEM